MFLCLVVSGLYEFIKQWVLKEIDFWRAVVIQGLVLNLNLYLLTLLKIALESRIEFLLFKKDTIERSISRYYLTEKYIQKNNVNESFWVARKSC